MSSGFPYKIYPLGDAAISIDFGNVIDRKINDHVMALYQYFQANTVQGITDIVPAYSSLTLHYNPAAWLWKGRKGLAAFDVLKSMLTEATALCAATQSSPSRIVKIPVCYESRYAPDLNLVAATAGIDRSEVIARHVACTYHVYMLGFLPGFAYMGEVDESIASPRKPRPKPIVAGSVAIAGKQTGIYPLDSPGGWQIIGRTPLSIFNRATGKTLLRPGDHVQFYSISGNEFHHY